MLDFIVIVIVIVLIILFYIYFSIYIIKTNSKNPFSSNTVYIALDEPVSIIIVARNEEENIINLLNDLNKQAYNGAIELIFVNDHSTDNTLALVKSYVSKIDIKVLNLEKYIVEQINFKKQAQLLGVEEAKHEFIIFLDADVRINSKLFILSHVNLYKRNGSHFQYGPVDLTSNNCLVSILDLIEWNALQAVTKAFALNKKHIMCNAANMTTQKTEYKKFVNKNHVLTTTASGDDMHLLQKNIIAKNMISYNNDVNAIITTNVNVNFKNYIHQRARWLSKVNTYTNKNLLLVMLLIAVFNMLFLVSIILFSITLNGFFLFVILIKLLVDIQIVKSFNAQQIPILKYTLASFMYPFISILIFFIAKFKLFTWKKRKVVY